MAKWLDRMQSNVWILRAKYKMYWNYKKMLYCLKCKKIQRVKTQESQRLVMGNNDSVKLCSVQQKKKKRIIKEQEASGLWSQLGIRTPISKIRLLGDTFCSEYITMNNIINKFLLAGDQFMPEMHMRQPGFTYSV